MRSRFPRPCSRPRSAGFSALGLALALALASSPVSKGQDSPSDASSLARYIPLEGLGVYVEYRGLDAQADAWKKTSASKILNETPTGAMLEEVAIQVLERWNPRAKENGRVWAEQVVTIVKHLARSGFALGVFNNPVDPKKGAAVVIVRDAYKDKAARAVMSDFFRQLNAPNTKPQAVVRAGHKVITGTDARGKAFTWWVDDSKKDDILLMFEKPEQADIVLETLDGKRPSALKHPRRAALLQPDGKFTPTGVAILEPIVFADNPSFEKVGLANLATFDFRWGFQDEAMVSMTRITTKGPRKGVLALFDGSTFDASKLPPVPENADGLTVASFDMDATANKLVVLARTFRPPGQQTGFDQFLDKMEARSKAPRKDDLLTHLGPKVAWFVLPGKPGASPAAGTLNVVGALMARAGMDQIPRFAMVFDIDNPSGFGKALDEAMIGINREFKAQGRPPGEAPAKGARGRGPTPPAPEFRLMPGETKMYVLNVPPELASQVPSSLRPSIRVGPKHAVLAVSPDVARAVLEIKQGWTPPKELALGEVARPASLKILNVGDPRDSMPELLASLPAKIQLLGNSLLAMQTPPPPPGGPNPGAPGLASAPGAGNPNSSGAPGAAPAGPKPFIIQVDAAKLPSAAAIKALLFPSFLAVESTNEELRIVSRDAFPSIADPAKVAIGLSLAMPAVQAARNAARGQAGPPGQNPPPVLNPPPGAIPPPGGATPPEGAGDRRMRNRPGAGASPAAPGGATARP